LQQAAFQTSRPKCEYYNAAARSPAIPAIPAPSPSICPEGAAAPELAAAAVELVLDADVTVAVFAVELLAPVAVADVLVEHTAAEGRVTPTGWQRLWANLMVAF